MCRNGTCFHNEAGKITCNLTLDGYRIQYGKRINSIKWRGSISCKATSGVTRNLLKSARKGDGVTELLLVAVDGWSRGV
jgi:hypothetical protein